MITTAESNPQQVIAAGAVYAVPSVLSESDFRALTPENLFGWRVAKKFGNRWFRGTIREFDFDAGFMVRYDDGDSEHMECAEALKLVQWFRRRFPMEATVVS